MPNEPSDPLFNRRIRFKDLTPDLQELILNAGGGGGAEIPVGSVVATLNDTEPDGWLFVEGQTGLSRTTYADLYAAWGPAGSDVLGPGDGSTTFDMPDPRGHFPFVTAASGTGSTLGGTFGELDHTHTGPSHTHTGPSHTHGVGTLDAAAGGGHTHSSAGSHDHGGRTDDDNATQAVYGSGGVSRTQIQHDHAIASGGGHTHDTISDHDHALSGATAADGTGATGSSGSGDTGTGNPPGFAFHLLVYTGV